MSHFRRSVKNMNENVIISIGNSVMPDIIKKDYGYLWVQDMWKDRTSYFFMTLQKIKKLKKRNYPINAAVIPITPDWIIIATVIITPAISSATATSPFLSSANSSIPLVSLSRIFNARYIATIASTMPSIS